MFLKIEIPALNQFLSSVVSCQPLAVIGFESQFALVAKSQVV